MAAPPLRPEAEEGSKGAEVCLFDQSQEDFSRAVRAISELATGDPQPGFPDAEAERLASSVTFLREWRHFSYEPKGVSFVYGAGSASSGDDTPEITLPQFSSASFPQVTHLEDGRDKNTDSSDFILFAGGSVWSLDWCPKLCDKPCSRVNCEYLAVAAHPPGSSYHKLGMPLIGRGIIQVWCLVAPFEEADPHQSMIAYSKSNRRGRPRKIPDENNSIESSSVPRKPIGRPRKIKLTTTDDSTEPCLKKPRGRPRKIEPATTDDHEEPSMKKPRGRPRKIEPATTDDHEEPSMKKPRGRPRKIKPATADDYAEPSLRKPRGRPRKLEPATADDYAEPSLRKPRGRPRKIKPATTADHAEPSLKKPRGRPRKTKCNVHLNAASLALSLCNANYKEESSAQHRKKPVSTECSSSTTFSGKEQNNQPTPKPSDNVLSVEKCKKELLVYTRRRVRPPAKKSAPNETCSLALSGDVQKMETSYTSIMPNNHLSSVENPKLLGSSMSEDMANEAGLVGCKSTVINREVMEMNDGEAANQVVHAPFEDSAQMIVEVENTEVVQIKKSSQNDNIITCAENPNLSAIPKGIHLPRVVLCLAHNGKVAWDIKWKPPLPNQSEQKSRLGFLAVLLGNGTLEVWEVPSPSIIQKIYSSSLMKGTDPRFLKLRPVFRCAKVKCGNIQSIPLTVDWSPSPHDMILAGCHDGTVALWKFSTDLPAQDSKPFMCVTAESVPIRALSWAPYVRVRKRQTPLSLLERMA
uniref:General transcription factor 3C polypeptide 2 n=2 Tax=Aegilops tauschii subsp. strangulata TaxID=200361 RepID=A0A452ZXD4_AEGTS